MPAHGDGCFTSAPLNAAASRNPISNSTAIPSATSGAVNRAGNTAPQVNPATVDIVTATAPTSTGHSGGPPLVASHAVWAYRMATPARNVSSSQHSVPASATDNRDHAARGVVASRSAVFLRPSLVPAQAAMPPANTLKPYSRSRSMTDARRVQTGGYPSAVRSGSR